MNIEYVPVSALKEYANNARIIPDAAVDYVAASIAEAGFINPIVVDAANVIVCGHVSRRAAIRAGLDIVPVVRIDDLTREEIDAYRLADNRVASMSFWDREKLSEEFAALAGTLSPSDLGFDLSMISGDSPESEKASREIKDTSRELNLDDFADEAFKHTCPHCGLKF